jgi:hypothetical protein
MLWSFPNVSRVTEKAGGLYRELQRSESILRGQGAGKQRHAAGFGGFGNVLVLGLFCESIIPVKASRILEPLAYK